MIHFRQILNPYDTFWTDELRHYFPNYQSHGINIDLFQCFSAYEVDSCLQLFRSHITRSPNLQRMIIDYQANFGKDEGVKNILKMFNLMGGV